MCVRTPQSRTPGSWTLNSWFHIPTGSGICSFPRKEILTTVSLCLVRTCRSFLDPQSKSVFHMAEAEGGLNEALIYAVISLSEGPQPHTVSHANALCLSSVLSRVDVQEQ